MRPLPHGVRAAATKTCRTGRGIQIQLHNWAWETFTNVIHTGNSVYGSLRKFMHLRFAIAYNFSIIYFRSRVEDFGGFFGVISWLRFARIQSELQYPRQPRVVLLLRKREDPRFILLCKVPLSFFFQVISLGSVFGPNLLVTNL